MLSDTEEDTPLQHRTDLCNKASADFCVSIHYNAVTGTWQAIAAGTETYSYPGNVADAKYASIIHPYVVQATGLKDRGCRQVNFHMVREPKCPAILVEFGFMDNRTDADLALQDSFRKRCTVGLAKGICAAFGVEYVAKKEDKDMTVQEAINIVQEKTGVDENTIQYLLYYKYGDALLLKLAGAMNK